MEAGAIGVHDTHLRSTVDGIDGFLASSCIIQEGSEDSDARHDLLAVGRPRWTENQTLLRENGACRFAFVDDE